MVNKCIREIVAFCITGATLFANACTAVERDIALSQNEPVFMYGTVPSASVTSENRNQQPKRMLRIQRIQGERFEQPTSNVSEAMMKYRDQQYAAVVNGEGITVQQLNKAVAQAIQQLKNQESRGYVSEMTQSVAQSTRREILNGLIEAVLIAQEAKKMGITVAPALVNEKIREIRSGFPSEELFRQALSEEGIDAETLERGIRHQLLIDALSRHLAERIEITDDMIERFHEQNRDLFESSEVLRVSRIVVGSRVEAEALLQKLKKGKQSFKELRQKFSLESNAEIEAEEVIERNDLPKDVEEHLFALKVGQISPVIQADSGFVIYKLIEKKQGGQMSPEEVKKRTENYLRVEYQQSAYYHWLSEIKEKAEIVVNESLFPRIAPTGTPSFNMQQKKLSPPKQNKDYFDKGIQRENSIIGWRGMIGVG